MSQNGPQPPPENLNDTATAPSAATPPTSPQPLAHRSNAPNPMPTRIAVRNAVIIAAGVALAFAGLTGSLDRSLNTAASVGVICFAPLAVLFVLVAFLSTYGVHARSLCGFCGYDRRGLKPAEHCPECGHVYDTKAPGYTAIGRRSLPVTAWLPPLLWLVVAPLSTRFAHDVASQRLLMIGWFGVLVFLIIHAGWRVTQLRR